MTLQKIDLDVDILLEIASHEAVIRQAYKDSVGVWTWSVGLTNATGHNVERYIGNPQPLQKCLDVFVWALRRYAQDVLEAFEGTKLTRQQFAAALSFHWNTGAIKKASWVKSFKRGEVSKAREQFMLYDKPAAIIPRRKKERDLFFDGVWSNKGKMTEYTHLSKKHTPIWSSAKQIKVEAELQRALDHKVVKVQEPPHVPVPIVVADPPVDTKTILVYSPSTLWLWLKSFV